MESWWDCLPPELATLIEWWSSYTIYRKRLTRLHQELKGRSVRLSIPIPCVRWPHQCPNTGVWYRKHSYQHPISWGQWDPSIRKYSCGTTLSGISAATGTDAYFENVIYNVRDDTIQYRPRKSVEIVHPAPVQFNLCTYRYCVCTVGKHVSLRRRYLRRHWMYHIIYPLEDYVIPFRLADREKMSPLQLLS